MRLGRNKDEAIETEERFSLINAKRSAEKGDKEQEADLSKLKKKDLLEIMLKQGEEIDSLRAQVADLQAQLDDRNFMLDRVGSIAEASLQVTKIFEEAEKAAKIYLMNIRSKVK